MTVFKNQGFGKFKKVVVSEIRMKTKPERHEKGWGYEEWIVNNKLYCGKILHFWKGKKFSLHYHNLKDETFYVISGKFSAIFYESLEDYAKKKSTFLELAKGDTIHIKPGVLHRLTALEEGEIIEFSTEHFEDDSYRVEPGDSQTANNKF